MRLLVTGGLGFIGSCFVRRALRSKKGVRVVNLDKKTYSGNLANVAEIARDPRYSWVRADIADRSAVRRAMEGCDAVVHFAAESHVDRSILDSGAFLRTNVLGTQVLLQAALDLKISRFLHVGTDEVYGSVERGRSRETDRLEPRSPYSSSKAGADLLALSYFVTHGLPVVVTRASNNFGPFQHPEKALPLLITNALDDQPFPLYGEGKNVRDWLYVEDHCRAIELLLEKGAPGQIYNVGGTAELENRRLVPKVLALMGKPLSLVRRVPDRPGHDKRYALDCAKLKTLGWRPEAPFDARLRETIEWYRSNRPWWEALKRRADFQAYYRRQYADRLKRSRALAPA